MVMNSKFKNSALSVVTALGLVLASAPNVYAETYLTIDQAKKILWEKTSMRKVPVKLTKQQIKSIKKSSNVRVRNDFINAWKTSDGGWFIVDQVVGKHEMIDVAVAITRNGKVKGVEILEYRETYGSEVRHPKWLAQFLGKGHRDVLEIDTTVKNISGATLSSVHVTEGVKRLLHTWDQVLRHI